jgi:sugar phosphate isomerase/epimerase
MTSLTFCLNTSTIKPQPLLEKIRLVADAGFRGVELWINDIYEYIGQGGEVRDVEKALSDYGLIVPCTIAVRNWGEASELEYHLALDEAKRRLELASRLGSPYLVATPPREPCDTAQLTARYKDLLELGRSAGCKPTFEYISFFGSAFKLSHAWEVVQQVDDADATLIYDSFHTWNSDSSLAELRQIPANRISHWHIDDAHPEMAATTQTDPNRVMPGDGQIDLAAEIAIMREIGYSGTVSLELFNRELWDQDPVDVLRIGYDRMQQLLG